MKKLSILSALGLLGAAALLLAKLYRDSFDWDIDWDKALDEYDPYSDK